jgi:hypothetical protein
MNLILVVTFEEVAIKFIFFVVFTLYRKVSPYGKFLNDKNAILTQNSSQAEIFA